MIFDKLKKASLTSVFSPQVQLWNKLSKFWELEFLESKVDNPLKILIKTFNATKYIESDIQNI